MSPEEIDRWLRTPTPPLLLDVRYPEEHALAALPGSVLIPLHELPQRWREIEKWQDRPIVAYCHHGIRSRHAAGFLKQCGFTAVENLDGGIDAWSTDVDPSVPRYS